MWLGQRSRHLFSTTTTAPVPSAGPVSAVSNDWAFSTLSTVLVLESVLPASRATGDRVIQVPVLSKRDGAPFADRLGAAIGAVIGSLLLIAVFFYCCISRGGSEPSTPTSSVISSPKPYSPRLINGQRRQVYRQRPIRRQPRPVTDETNTWAAVNETVTSSLPTQGNGTTIEDPGTSPPAEGNRNQTTREDPPGNQLTEENQRIEEDGGTTRPAEGNQNQNQPTGENSPGNQLKEENQRIGEDGGTTRPAEGNQNHNQPTGENSPGNQLKEENQRIGEDLGTSRSAEGNQNRNQQPGGDWTRNQATGDDAGRPQSAEENRTMGQAPGNILPREAEEATQAQTDRPNSPPQGDQQTAQSPRVQATDENGTPATRAPTPGAPPPGDTQNPDHDSQSCKPSSTISSIGRTSIRSVNINFPLSTTAPVDASTSSAPRVPQRNPSRRPLRLDILSRSRTNQRTGAPSAAGHWIRPAPQRRQSQTLNPRAASRPPAAPLSGQAADRPTMQDHLRAEAEARQRVLDEGRQVGYEDGVRDGHDLGYRQGFYQQPPHIFPHRPRTWSGEPARIRRCGNRGRDTVTTA